MAHLKKSKTIRVIIPIAPANCGKSYFISAITRIAETHRPVCGRWRIINDNSGEIGDSLMTLYTTILTSGNSNKTASSVYYRFLLKAADEEHSIIIFDQPGGDVFDYPKQKRWKENERNLLDYLAKWNDEYDYEIKICPLIIINMPIVDNSKEIVRMPTSYADILRTYFSDQIIESCVLYYAASDYPPYLKGPAFEKKLIELNNDTPLGKADALRHQLTPHTLRIVNELLKWIEELKRFNEIRSNVGIFFGSSVGAKNDGTPNWDVTAGNREDLSYWVPLYVVEPLIYCCGGTLHE